MKPTCFNRKMGITLPIIQAPMAGGVTTPELIAAVSNAGGLGSLGAGYMSPVEIKQAIKKIRQLTNKPFAVNLFISNEYSATTSQIQKACIDVQQACRELNIEIEPVTEPFSPSFEDQIQVLVEEKIPVFSYTFGLLDPYWFDQFKKNHTFLVGTATNLSEAFSLEENGADFIVAQGCEAGGHRGTFLGKAEHSLIGLLSLVPQLVDQIKVPVIASGGIMDGRGIISACYLGAEGVQMGTAFLSCSESGIPNAYKHALLTQQQDNTRLTRAFSGKLARGIRNQFMERMQESIHILDYPVQNVLTQKMRKKAKETNNNDFMSLWAGQSATLCRNLSAHDLIKKLVSESNSMSKKNPIQL